MKDVKLSIIIPTKDRYKYLLPLIKMLDGFGFKHTELVIEDNSADNEECKRFIIENAFSIPIVYNQNTFQIPICQNIDNAIKHSNGEYVCVIGDDDAVTPLIEDYVDWMRKNGVDSVRQKSELTYKWPSFTDDGGHAQGAVLTYQTVGDYNHDVDTVEAVKAVIDSGIMTLGNMPCVYQGIVKRTTLDKLYDIGGTFFPGPSPDMGNAMSLCFVVEKHYATEIPLIISGGSEFQGGKNAKIKKWVQPLENVPFISAEAKSKWDKRIPYFWCGHTVWPESGIKGLEYVGKQSYLDAMDFDLLLSKCLYRGFEYRKDILARTSNKTRVILLFIKFYIREDLAMLKRSLMKKMDLVAQGAKRIGNLNTIEAAVSCLMKEYKKAI